MFPLVSRPSGSWSRLRWIAFDHVEADECGSMNQWLAPRAEVPTGRWAAWSR
ncbi:MAG: hypothetical protein M5U14_13140 [Acidimicrobiia bacterium]|nr:hypothetical protein [Acidimicrobiia bacterium]